MLVYSFFEHFQTPQFILFAVVEKPFIMILDNTCIMKSIPHANCFHNIPKQTLTKIVVAIASFTN